MWLFYHDKWICSIGSQLQKSSDQWMISTISTICFFQWCLIVNLGTERFWFHECHSTVKLQSRSTLLWIMPYCTGCWSNPWSCFHYFLFFEYISPFPIPYSSGLDQHPVPLLEYCASHLTELNEQYLWVMGTRWVSTRMNHWVTLLNNEQHCRILYDAVLSR